MFRRGAPTQTGKPFTEAKRRSVMEKKELLYEGKAKKVYRTDNEDVLIVR